MWKLKQRRSYWAGKWQGGTRARSYLIVIYEIGFCTGQIFGTGFVKEVFTGFFSGVDPLGDDDI